VSLNLGWFDFFSRRLPKSSSGAYFSSRGPVESLQPDSSGRLSSRAKTPSSDCLPPTTADPIVEALRSATFADPTVTYGKLSSDEAPQFLRVLLDDPEVKLDAVRWHSRTAGNYPCVIVELPPPQAAGRPHFAGLLVTMAMRKVPDRITPTQVRYFTLEKRNDDLDDQTTVFCEWTAKGERRSFGSGPAPRVDRFLFALSGMAR
jgi:hypothetical protein